MKRFFAFAALLAIFAFPSAALAAETIDSFNVKATLTSERLLSVTETVSYDFGDEYRHGIFREIPVTYLRNRATYKLRLERVTVTMDNAPIPFEISESGGTMTVKIGDPNETITGPHVYAISYQTDRAVTFFDGHGELYWNVTGDAWQVPVASSAFTIDLPDAPAATACFTGPFGSTESACDIASRDRSVTISSTRLLNAGEGMTVVVGLPAGAVREPTTFEKILMILRDNGILAVPLIVLIAMWRLWWARGRDPKLGTIIPIYESPDGLSPSELAAVREEGGVPSRGITATIIGLARRGYLHLRYGEEKTFLGSKQTFALIKKKDADAALTAAERIVFDGLFAEGGEVELKDLQKNKFYLSVAKAKEAVWTRLAELKVFDARPATVRMIYFAAGIAVAWGMLFLGAVTPLGPVAAVLTGLIIMGFGWVMPRRTVKGAKLLADAKGFEWFMRVTEKDRLAFHNAPKRTPAQFEALLPFAIALGVEKEWARQFEGIELAPPEWTEGTGVRTWSTMNFVSSLGAFHTQAVSSGYASPSSAGSGGSGFSGGGSGGGFGGGGGGSW